MELMQRKENTIGRIKVVGAKSAVLEGCKGAIRGWGIQGATGDQEGHT